MAAAAAIGIGGVALPLVEPGILVSVVLLGLLIAAGARLSLVTTGSLVALFAVMHGYAHGAEMPAGDVFSYSAGFLGTTLLLLSSGVAFGELLKGAPAGRLAARATGAAIAAAGFLLIVG
jgi:urease accessory protein